MSHDVVSKHTFNTFRVAEELVPDKINRNTYLGAMALAIIMLVLSLVMYQKLPERLPLLWTLPWGEARLVPKIGIFGGSALVVMVVIVNVILSKSWVGGGSLGSRILSAASLIVAIAFLIALWGVLQSFFL